MQIRTKINVISYSLAAIVVATSALLFVSLEQLSFYQRNVQFSSERLYEYLELKSFVLRTYKEIFDLQHTKDLGLLVDSEINQRQVTQARDAVATMLTAIASTNQHHRAFFRSEPFVIAWQDEGASTNETGSDAKILKDTSIMVDQIFAMLAKASETRIEHERIMLSNQVERIYDGSFSDLIKSETDDEHEDERKSYRVIEQFHGWARNAGLGLGAVSLLFLIYLIRGFARPLALRLRRLMDGVDSVARGEAIVQVDVDGHDELRLLAITFNHMVTEIANNHAALIASSKMSALGEMAGGIAHEINNPLSIIAARASQIRRLLDRQPLDIANVQKFTESIELTATRIAGIISGLRSFSRNADKDPFVETSVQQMVSDTVALCSERFKNHGVQLTISPIDPELRVECRATQIVQVLVNLLNNAHDAIEPLAQKWIRVDMLAGTDTVEISVTDSGPGIPAEVRNKIFQPFFTTKEIGKGTGLGLSIASGIVADHSGKITVDQGHVNTRFVLVMPKNQPKAQVSADKVKKAA